jgi:hypothetical protein
MTDAEQQKVIKDLLSERDELKKGIAALQADLTKRAASFEQISRRLLGDPSTVLIEADSVCLRRRNEHVQDQRFPIEHFDLARLSGFTDQLRSAENRLREITTQLKSMGH